MDRQNRERPRNLVEVARDAVLNWFRHASSPCFLLLGVRLDGAVRKTLRSVKICKLAEMAEPSALDGVTSRR
jgi:hypothetical protein